LNSLLPEPRTWSGKGGAYDRFSSSSGDGRQIHCVVTQFKAKHGSIWNELLKRTLSRGLFAGEKRVEQTLSDQPGLIEWSVRVDLGNRICSTQTRWVSEDAVDEFLRGNADHRSAMQSAETWVQDGSAVVASWTETVGDTGYRAGFTDRDWTTALDLLRTSGEIRY
jgi:hypothetical protein